MAPCRQGSSHEGGPFHRRADGRDPAGSRQGGVTEVAKKHKVSEQTIYNWRRHFGTLEPVDVKRLRRVESENAKLKRMLAERDLEIDTLKEINRRKW